MNTLARSRRDLAVALIAVLFTLAAFAASTASASITGWNEPAYTKTANNNTFWWNWQAFTGLNENGTSNYNYGFCTSTYHNGVREEYSKTPNDAGNTCELLRGSSTGAASGNRAYYPYSGTSTTLLDGNTYQMCGTGYYWNLYLWVIDNASSNTCPSTTIDRNKPSIGVSVDGTAEYTNNPQLALHIDYQDATSPPWFAATAGQASNWTCVNLGAPCTPSGSPDTNCSARHFANSRTDYFDCQANVPAASPDGRYYFCAYSADAAVPDNPSGTNQFANAFSNNANISDTQCGYVTLDRAAPAVQASASATSVQVGQLVNFSSSASDPSGVSGQYAWSYGDNTANGSGANTSHTYTQPGTYVARVTTADGAGNQGQGTVTVTVNPPPSGGGSTTTSGGGGNTTSGGGTITSTNSISSGMVSQQAGGGGTQQAALAGARFVVPKKFKAGKRTLLLAATSTGSGRLTAALLRGSKIISQGGFNLPGAGTYAVKLKVPKKLKAGRYSVKLTFAPTGGTGKSKSVKIKVIVPKKKRGARKVAVEPGGAVKGVAIARSRR